MRSTEIATGLGILKNIVSVCVRARQSQTYVAEVGMSCDTSLETGMESE